MSGSQVYRFVSPSAIIDDGVVFGRDCIVRDFCHFIGAGSYGAAASIGSGVRFGQGCIINQSVTIGDHCKLQDYVNICPYVTVGDSVFIGSNVVFTNVVRPGVGIDPDYMPTSVGPFVSIGAGCTILPGIEIGAYALIGAGSVVTRSVRSHECVFGNPARHHQWVDTKHSPLFFDESLFCHGTDGCTYVLDTCSDSIKICSVRDAELFCRETI